MHLTIRESEDHIPAPLILGEIRGRTGPIHPLSNLARCELLHVGDARLFDRLGECHTQNQAAADQNNTSNVESTAADDYETP